MDISTSLLIHRKEQVAFHIDLSLIVTTRLKTHPAEITHKSIYNMMIRVSHTSNRNEDLVSMPVCLPSLQCLDTPA